MRKKQPVDIKAHVDGIKGFKGPVIDGFFDEYSFLSNFYPAPIMMNGVEFKTSEHAYQALKLEDPELAMEVAREPTAFKAKQRLHEIIKKHNLKHPDIPQLIVIMDRCIAAKFRSGSALARMLEETDPALLVEGNWWSDVTWGVCDGEGMNLLGKALMRRRMNLLQRTVYAWESNYLYPGLEF